MYMYKYIIYIECIYHIYTYKYLHFLYMYMQKPLELGSIKALLRTCGAVSMCSKLAAHSVCSSCSQIL